MAKTNFKSKNLEQMKVVLGQLEKKDLKVGFLETSHYPDGTPVAYVAAIQEFGHGSIPPRPFMRPAQEANRDKWSKAFARMVQAAINGSMDLEQGLEQLGMVAAGDVRKAIKAVTAPPLSPVTIAMRQRRIKGKKSASTKPLVDEGIMIQSVASVVENK